MQRVVIAMCAALALTNAGAQFATGAKPGEHGTTPPSASPKVGGREAERSLSQARADCRRVAKDARSDCVRQAQSEYDKTQRAVKPPRGTATEPIKP
jgi:hypothetical protein